MLSVPIDLKRLEMLIEQETRKNYKSNEEILQEIFNESRKVKEIGLQKISIQESLTEKSIKSKIKYLNESANSNNRIDSFCCGKSCVDLTHYKPEE